MKNAMHRAWGLVPMAGAAFLLALVPAMGGCNVAAAVYTVVHGPEKTDAKYELDETKSTVVFVDDMTNVLPSRSLRSDISAAVEKDLLDRGLVKDMIDHRAVMSVTNKDRYGKPMSVSDVGKAVGADVVIYVQITGFALSADGVSASPVGSARMKVIDVKEQKRLWPAVEAEGDMRVQMRQGQGIAPTTITEQNVMFQKLATEFGKGISQAFYEHENQDKAGRGGPTVSGS